MANRLIWLAVLAIACGPGDVKAPVARGKGLEPAALPAPAEARIYDAAIRAAFDTGPGLLLYTHPRRLPRSAGYNGGDSIPTALVTTLRNRGLVKGSCDPERDSPTGTPRCNAPEAGYLIRASDVLRAGKDTVQLYFAAERFGTPSGVKQAPFHFEKIYQLIREGSAWRVVREARVTDDKRQEN